MSMKFLKTIAPAALTELWEKVSGNIVPKDTSANVGIGTDSPVKNLHVHNVSAAAAVIKLTNATVGEANGVSLLEHTSGVAVLQSVGTGVNGSVSIEVADGTEALNIASAKDVTVSLGNLVIGTAGKGIDFSAQSSPAAGMTSELLDRYEEGTWTPVVSDGTNNATMNSTYEDHYYTRIGRVVHCTGYLVTDGMGSVSGGLRITGLPFTVGSQYSASCGAYGSGMVITAGQTVGLRVIPSQTYAYLTIWDATTGTTQLTSTQWDDGAMMISFTYML